MTTSIQKAPAPGAVMLHNFSDEQVNLIKSQIAPQATDDELKMFLHHCSKTKLDPLSRQIYCIHRNAKVRKQDPQTGRWFDDYVQKMTIQTSIDGFRVIAERTGDYGGVSEPEFVYAADGKTILFCRITVFRWRGEVRYPAAVAVAYWSEYLPADAFMWNKMPHGQISKVAEALALRKAFPQDLGGMYIEEEMQQADHGGENPAAVVVTEVKEQPTPELNPASVKINPDDMKKHAFPEVRESFMALWKEYHDLDPSDADVYHPDKWDEQLNHSNAAYLRAEEMLRAKISTFEKANP